MDNIQSITTKQVAALLDVSEETVKQDRKTQRLKIPYIRVGRSVRYLMDDLRAWIEQHRVA